MANTKSNLTQKQKRALADLLLREAGAIVEFWSEKTEFFDDLHGVSPDDAAEVLAHWLKSLPGDSWDFRLPEVWKK